MGWADETEATSVVSGWLLSYSYCLQERGVYAGARRYSPSFIKKCREKNSGNEILAQISSGGFGPNGRERKRWQAWKAADYQSGAAWAPFLFLYFLKTFFTEIYFRFHILQFYTLPPGRGWQGPTCK